MPPRDAGTAAAEVGAGEDAPAGACSRAVNSQRPGLMPAAARSRRESRRPRGAVAAPASATPTAASVETPDGTVPGIGDAGPVAGDGGAGIAAVGADGAVAVVAGGGGPFGSALLAGSVGRRGVIGFSALAVSASVAASNPPANAILTCRGLMVLPRVARTSARPASPLPRWASHAGGMTAAAPIQPLGRGLVPRGSRLARRGTGSGPEYRSMSRPACPAMLSETKSAAGKAPKRDAAERKQPRCCRVCRRRTGATRARLCQTRNSGAKPRRNGIECRLAYNRYQHLAAPARATQTLCDGIVTE